MESGNGKLTCTKNNTSPATRVTSRLQSPSRSKSNNKIVANIVTPKPKITLEVQNNPTELVYLTSTTSKTSLGIKSMTANLAKVLEERQNKNEHKFK